MGGFPCSIIAFDLTSTIVFYVFVLYLPVWMVIGLNLTEHMHDSCGPGKGTLPVLVSGKDFMPLCLERPLLFFFCC